MKLPEALETQKWNAVVWRRMAPIGSNILRLGSPLIELLRNPKKCGIDGEEITLGGVPWVTENSHCSYFVSSLPDYCCLKMPVLS